MRSILLVGLVAAVALVTVGSAQRRSKGSCMGRWYYDDPDKLAHNLGKAACKYSRPEGVKDCKFWFNRNRGMGSDPYASQGDDYVFTCKDGGKKYIFAYQRAQNVNTPNLRQIACVKKDDHTRTGLTRTVGAWTVKGGKQVLDSRAENNVMTCSGRW